MAQTGNPNFTSLDAQFSLRPRSLALLNNYLFVNISKIQNYLSLKIMTIFSKIQNRFMRLLNILMFTGHHSWALPPVTTSILIRMWSQWQGSIWLQKGKDFLSGLYPLWNRSKLFTWLVKHDWLAITNLRSYYPFMLQWEDKAIPDTSQAQVYELFLVLYARWWKLS